MDESSERSLYRGPPAPRPGRLKAVADARAVGVGDAHAMWATVVRDGEEDYVAVEEPLEIRVDGAPLAVTMRTPVTTGEAVGFYTEWLIDGPHKAA